MKPRIGIYICHCGLNIANTVDVEAVREFAGRLPQVVSARDYTYMCSDPGQALITQDIKELGLTHVVVASCSPRMHEPTFRAAIQKAGLNPYVLQMANIREQCSWVHTDKELATRKAMDLVASAAAKAAWLIPLEEREVGVNQAALVVGGGIAGLQSALDIADAGFDVHLVEREPHLGGRAAQLDKTFPTLESVSDLIGPVVERVVSHPRIHVHLNAKLEKVDGYVGNFSVTIREQPAYVDPARCDGCGKCQEACPISVPDAGNANLSNRKAVYQPSPGAVFVVDERNCRFIQDHICASDPRCAAACPHNAIDFSQDEKMTVSDVGVIIVATGAGVFDASLKPELGLGAYRNVITSLQFERLARTGKLGQTYGSVRQVVFVQCVGSRDETAGHPYCSRICCMVGAKQAHGIRHEFPDAQVTVFFADVRTFGKGHEEFYDLVRKEGVRYRRGYVSEVYRHGDRLVVRAEDTLIQKPIEVEADLVVLGVGLTPCDGTDEIASLLGLPRSTDGFLLEAHPKLRPVETATDGVFLAGTCQGPKDIVDTIAQARAAASSALAPLCRGRVMVESTTAVVNQEMCAGCGLCVATCPYGAPALNPRTGKAQVNGVLCKGCGGCEAACPSKAIQVMQSTPRQVMSEIAALVS